MKSYKTLHNISDKHLSSSRRHLTCTSYISFRRSCSNASKISQNLWEHIVSMTIYYEQSDHLSAKWLKLHRHIQTGYKNWYFPLNVASVFPDPYMAPRSISLLLLFIQHSTLSQFSFGILIANSWIEYFKLFHPTWHFALSVLQKISEGEYLNIKKGILCFVDCASYCNLCK